MSTPSSSSFNFEFTPASPIDPSETLDIAFDSHHIFSVSPEQLSENAGDFSFEWPMEIRKFLSGSTSIEITLASSGDSIFKQEITFSPDSHRVNIATSDGTPLFVNKFNRLITKISENSDLRKEIVACAKKLETELTAKGYQIALCSGALLGAVRNGKMIDHDDDIDFLFLSEESNIARLNEYSDQLAADLKSLGYNVFQHSGAHVQAQFLGEQSEIKFYIDFFLGFWKNGIYNQPIALRSNLAKSDITPFSKITFEGEIFNAPASPENWLAALYGDDWQTPNPAFHFTASERTKSDFRKWFGVSRESDINFWNGYSQLGEFMQPFDGWERHFEYIQRYLDPSIPILDIGFGNAEFTQTLQDSGFDVIAIDFNQHAHWLAQKHHPNLDLHQINLLEPRDIAKLRALLPPKYNISCSFGFNAFWIVARKSALKLLQFGSKAVISFDSDFNESIFSGPNPLTRPFTSKREMAELALAGCYIAKSETFTRSAAINQGKPASRIAKIQLVKKFVPL